VGEVARRFPPGSEWLYVKLFTGPATADEVLARAVPVVGRALASGQADRWFFIRYGDPDWHLRLRLRGAPDRLLGETLPLLHHAMAPLVATGQLWRVEVDTYEREVERYGGAGAIALAEGMFHADSDAVVEILRQLGGDAGADLRWRVALLGIDLGFDDLGLSLDQRRAVARRARDGYGREFGAAREFQEAVSKRFRGERRALEGLFDPGAALPPELASSVQALRRRSVRVGEPARAIADLAAAGRLSVDVEELAMSFAHMHVNRLLRSAQRAQELVLYEFLDRIYSSRAARRAR
jgi:thiopeptide-type bacteriocin biosynthesis protein